MVKVEVIYISEGQHVFQCRLSLLEGACVADALEASGLWAQYPETRAYALGIFSRPVEPFTTIKTGDRIEIYRGLTKDPKQKRRERARKGS